MATAQSPGPWDATQEEKKWRESLQSGRDALNQHGDQLSKSSPDFFLLCLAELDAGSQLARAEYFATRATFLAQLRRLTAEPTRPSRPVPSIEAYRESQKWWLESMVEVYERDS